MTPSSLKPNKVRSFIVRIYRSRADRSDCLVGVVEEVGTEGINPFKSLQELGKILKRPAGKKSKGG